MFKIKRKTKEQFQEELNNIFGENEFIVMGEYINNQIKIEVLHTKCGNRILKRPSKMVNCHEGCYICNGKNQYKTTESFKEEVYKKYGDKFTIIGEYVKAREKIKVICNFCNKEFAVTPDNLLRGKGCPNCSNLITYEEYEVRLKEMYGNDWTLYGEWLGTTKPTLFKHKCGEIRKIAPYALTQMRRKCLKCEKYFSGLHLSVRKILSDMEIDFKEEFKFEDCKYKNLLPFDFYIEKYNLCIEVDGKQHFEAVSWFGGEEVFKEIKKRDIIKNEYCAEKNINLLRLKYNEKNKFESNIKEYINNILHANTEVS